LQKTPHAAEWWIYLDIIHDPNERDNSASIRVTDSNEADVFLVPFMASQAFNCDNKYHFLRHNFREICGSSFGKNAALQVMTENVNQLLVSLVLYCSFFWFASFILQLRSDDLFMGSTNINNILSANLSIIVLGHEICWDHILRLCMRFSSPKSLLVSSPKRMSKEKLQQTMLRAPCISPQLLGKGRQVHSSARFGRRSLF
jgi:hypothetical protein